MVTTLSLGLSVSSQSCVPGRASVAKDEQRPKYCRACGAPGGEHGELLEKHKGGTKQHVYLCPLCHMCLHLDVAGLRNAGRIIWLPEITQVELNVLCLAGFVVLRKSGVYRHDAHAQAMQGQFSRLYQTFEERANAVETFLSGEAQKTAIPRFALSSPTYIAGLMVHTQKDTGLSSADLAKRIGGLRLLPDYLAFEKYVAQVSRVVTAKYPVNRWMSAVEQHTHDDFTNSQSGELDDDGSFDAGLDPHQDQAESL